jgi:CDP-paratose 2-epimerase
VLKRGEDLVIFDNLYRTGSEKNLEWLKSLGKFTFLQKDIRESKAIAEAVATEKPDVIFHLAGQVAMTTSIKDPRLDFEINALGTFNLLDAARLHAPNAVIIYSSSNKTYGDMEHIRYEETPTRYTATDFPNGFPETITLEFCSPYGCSKGAADQYMLDFHRIYGLKTVVFRHSSMFGSRQFSTYDQGWIGWFCQQAIETKTGKSKAPFTISGNGKQVRDVLYADDMIALYFQTVTHIEAAKGQVFNIGGGMDNSLSLLELFALLEKELGITLQYTKLPPRESDQKVFVADLTKAKRLLQWQPKVDKVTGIRNMLTWSAKHA